MFKLFEPKLLDFPFLKPEKKPEKKQLTPLVRMAKTDKMTKAPYVTLAGVVRPFEQGVTYTGDTMWTRMTMDIDQELNSFARFIEEIIKQDGNQYTFYVHTRLELQKKGLTYEDVKFNRDNWVQMFNNGPYSGYWTGSIQIDKNLIGYTDKYIMIRDITESEDDWGDVTYSEEWRFIEK